MEGISFMVLEIVFDRVNYRLGDREISRYTQDNHPFAQVGKIKQLLIGRNIVNPRIGAGVCRNYQSVTGDDTKAVGHISISAIECGRDRDPTAMFDPITKNSGGVDRYFTLNLCKPSAIPDPTAVTC
jgi:hypothetical protein